MASSSRPLFRQRLRGADLRNRLVLPGPTGRRRLLDLGGGAAVRVHGRHGARQLAAAGADADAARIHSSVVAALEAGIAILGLTIPIALPYIQEIYLTLAEPGANAVLLRALVCVIVLTPPTMLMGATLPAIARWRFRDQEAESVGMLYMANLAGAATGTVLAGFYLLRVHDTVVATAVAVTLNTVVAAAFWLMAQPTADEPNASIAALVLMSHCPCHLRRCGDFRIHRARRRSGVDASTLAAFWRQRLYVLADPRRVPDRPWHRRIRRLELARRTTNRARDAGCYSDGVRRCDRIWRLGDCQPAADAWQPTALFSRTYVRPRPWPSPSMPCAADFACYRRRSCGARVFRSPGGGRGRRLQPHVARINATNTLGALAGAIAFTLIGIPMLGSHGAQQALVVCAASSGAMLVWSGLATG